MKTKQINIEEPCHQSWEQMRGDEQRRFCDHCDKHVHNLSAMTKAQAQELLEREADLCVIYKYDDQDELVFAPAPTRHQLQLQGVRKLLAAAALAVPMMLAACDEPAPLQELPTATSPITLDDDGAKLASPATLDQAATAAQGASRAPSPPPAQPREATPELRESLGQARVELTPETAREDHHLNEQPAEDEVSCDGAADTSNGPQIERLEAIPPKELATQKAQEPLQNKQLRKTMGAPVKMGKVQTRHP